MKNFVGENNILPLTELKFYRFLLQREHFQTYFLENMAFLITALSEIRLHATAGEYFAVWLGTGIWRKSLSFAVILGTVILGSFLKF